MRRKTCRASEDNNDIIPHDFATTSDHKQRRQFARVTFRCNGGLTRIKATKWLSTKDNTNNSYV
ncbi:hypothetical protein Mapa_007413 [Marchantia paleacea]|nr:hypothetical protein Mapa_007413 [Marchantia paleacea]